MTGDMHQALAERRELIEQRADAVLVRALAGQEPWVARLGKPPKDKKLHAWRRAARTIAAYCDRYQITEDRDPLGPVPERTSQKIEAARARAALNRAQAITNDERLVQEARPTAQARPTLRL